MLGAQPFYGRTRARGARRAAPYTSDWKAAPHRKSTVVRRGAAAAVLRSRPDPNAPRRTRRAARRRGRAAAAVAEREPAVLRRTLGLAGAGRFARAAPLAPRLPPQRHVRQGRLRPVHGRLRRDEEERARAALGRRGGAGTVDGTAAATRIRRGDDTLAATPRPRRSRPSAVGPTSGVSTFIFETRDDDVRRDRAGAMWQHAQQILLPCWSLFRRFPGLRPVVQLAPGVRAPARRRDRETSRAPSREARSRAQVGLTATHPWTNFFLVDAMRATASREAADDPCPVVGGLRRGTGTGSAGSEILWLAAARDGAALAANAGLAARRRARHRTSSKMAAQRVTPARVLSNALARDVPTRFARRRRRPRGRGRSSAC